MAQANPSYTPDERSRGVRLNKRIDYDQELIHGIINETPILHVSFNAPVKSGPQFPTILPMLGVVSTYNDEEHPSVYLHGSGVARLFRITANDEVPLTVCGSLLDGYVLALAPFHNSCNYRSAVVFGYGSVVTNDDEINFALRAIVNNSNPNRWENSRSPPTKAELNATGVLKVRIETASAKVRTGGPHDDKADLSNSTLTSSCWTGVIPTYQVLGEPVADEVSQVKAVPEYISDWVADTNAMNEQRAIDALDG